MNKDRRWRRQDAFWLYLVRSCALSIGIKGYILKSGGSQTSLWLLIYHLGCLLKCRFLSSTSRNSNSVKLDWESGIFIFNKYLRLLHISTTWNFKDGQFDTVVNPWSSGVFKCLTCITLDMLLNPLCSRFYICKWGKVTVIAF